MKKSHFPILPLLGVLLVFPLFYKRRPRVARRAVIHAKPSEIFPFLNDLRNWPLWTEWARRDEMHFSYSGPPAGVGALQRWEGCCMTGEMRLVQSVQDERIAYDLEINHGKYNLDGVLALEPEGDFTRVTWLCKWELSRNPYARYLDFFFMWKIGRDFSAGLENLTELIEKRHHAPAANLS